MRLITRAGRRPSLYARSLIDRRAGETEAAASWTNRVINQTADWVLGRNPGTAWRHMRDLYGRHEGETILVLGSGPSLKLCPKDPGLTTIAINRAIRAVPANYWAWHDPDSWDQSKDHLYARVAEMITIAQAFKQIPKDRVAYLVEGDSRPTRYRENPPLYNCDLTLTWVIHLCLRMGAKRVVTLGTEFDRSGQYDGFVQPDRTRDWQDAQHVAGYPRIYRMLKMDRSEWEERPMEILDLSGGNMPCPKTKPELVFS